MSDVHHQHLRLPGYMLSCVHSASLTKADIQRLLFSSSHIGHKVAHILILIVFLVIVIAIVLVIRRSASRGVVVRGHCRVHPVVVTPAAPPHHNMRLHVLSTRDAAPLLYPCTVCLHVTLNVQAAANKGAEDSVSDRLQSQAVSSQHTASCIHTYPTGFILMDIVAGWRRRRLIMLKSKGRLLLLPGAPGRRPSELPLWTHSYMSATLQQRYMFRLGALAHGTIKGRQANL